MNLSGKMKGVVHRTLTNVRTLIHKYKSAPMFLLVKKLNELLRGWANYHRHIVASAAFKRVDNYVYDQMWRMLRKRHRNKSSNWLYRKYWMASGKKWVLTVLHKAYGKTRMYQVIKVGHIGIKRHRKIKADANPYMPEYGRYFWLRRHVKDAKLLPALSARQMRLALY